MQSVRREAMGNVDNAWLSMDHETNLMIISGIMLFDDRIDFARLTALFADRLVAPFPRFRQRVVDWPAGSGRKYWAEDRNFDIRSHVSHIALPEPGDKATLQQLISDLMRSNLDQSKPLWRVYLIDNVSSDTAANGCALFARFHHAIADGIALIQVMLSLADETATPSPEPTIDHETPERRSGFVDAAGGSRITRPARLAARLLRTANRGLNQPQELVSAVRSLGFLSAASAATLTRLLILPAERASSLRGPLCTTKRVVWSAAVDLAQVKRIGRTSGATVNDVLIAALAGALRAHLLSTDGGDTLEDIRTMVPVNLRPPDAPLTLGNQFGLVYLSLPVSLDDPLERLREVKRRMDILKRSPEAAVAFQLLSVLGMLPGEFSAMAATIFAGKATAVLTNVPGPRRPLYVAGCRVKRLLFWVPQSGDIGLGISIISYAGEVNLGLIVDEGLVSDPESIMSAFEAQFERMTSAAANLADAADGPVRH